MCVCVCECVVCVISSCVLQWDSITGWCYRMCSVGWDSHAQ